MKVTKLPDTFREETQIVKVPVPGKKEFVLSQEEAELVCDILISRNLNEVLNSMKQIERPLMVKDWKNVSTETFMGDFYRLFNELRSSLGKI